MWSIVLKLASGRWKTRTAPLFSHIYADFPHFRVFGRKQSCSACVWTLFDGESPLIRRLLTYQPGLSRCEGKRHVISILGRPGNWPADQMLMQRLFGQCPNELLYFYGGASLGCPKKTFFFKFLLKLLKNIP